MRDSSQDLELPRRFLRRAPMIAPGERIYAIGDIHGRADLFIHLMRAIARDKEVRPLEGRQAKIVVLGDFIDRGPSSRQILEAFSRLQSHSGLTVLLGNHEASMLACIDAVEDPRDGWLDFGGREALMSLGVAEPDADESAEAFAQRLAEKIGAPTLEWLRSLPLYVTSGDYLFVHAGVRPGIALSRQSSRDLLWIRDKFLSSTRQHSHIVVHGHSIVDEIEVCPNRIGVDTGAWCTGRLSALALEDDRGWAISVEDDAGVRVFGRSVPATTAR